MAKTKSLSFPKSLVTPVANALREQLKGLKKRKREIDKDDPFNEVDRMYDNASPDDNAAEQVDHSRTLALKDRLDRQIIQIRKALTKVKVGSYGICEDCGKMIDTNRLMIEPEAIYCAKCQRKREK